MPHKNKNGNARGKSLVYEFNENIPHLAHKHIHNNSVLIG